MSLGVSLWESLPWLPWPPWDDPSRQRVSVTQATNSAFYFPPFFLAWT